jgi:hypothetical protein
MKWALAAMAYVAVAAAAFSRQTWVFADLLWAASLLAVVFAALVAGFDRGRRQIAAAGFVVASGCFLLCMALDQNAVPTNRLLAAAGIYAQAPVQSLAGAAQYAPSPQRVMRRVPVSETRITNGVPVRTTRIVDEEIAVGSPVATGAWNSTPAANTGYATYSSPAMAPTPVAVPLAPLGSWMSNADSATYLYRSGRAVGMMGFGLLGCLVGLLAHKAVRSNLDHCVA